MKLSLFMGTSNSQYKYILVNEKKKENPLFHEMR